MNRLLVFGLSPLPFEDMTRNFGPGIRAWQFIQPLLEKGYEILLLANRIPFIYPDRTPPEVQLRKGTFTYLHMSDEMFQNTRRIQELHDSFQPDAILVATIFSIPALINLRTDVPIWIDLFGHVLSEAQAKAHRYQDDSYLEHFWKHEILAINKGDIFSSVSHAQAAAIVGELGLIGRLNYTTTGYVFCHTIPCAMDPEPLKHKKHVYRGNLVPSDAFVVLWSGGFNTWTDIDTLMNGLELAMERNPNIWFVSTGAQIDGHDEKTYPEFLQRVSKSPYKNRFVNRGWVPKLEVHNYYFEADIGINIDRFMYEGFFGSKNRILDWMRAGLPSLTGELCELSKELTEKKIGFNFPIHSPEKLAEKLLYLISKPDLLKATGERARKYGLEILGFNHTTQPFQNWLENPQKSPDHSGENQPCFQPMKTLSDLSENNALITELKVAKKYTKELEEYIHYIENEFARLEKTKLIKLRNQKPEIQPQPTPLPNVSSKSLVSVIIVSWNGVKYLKNCLKSLLNEQYPDLEIIVVDNASTDGSPEYVAKHFPDVKIIRNNRNLGFSKGINIGLKSATGKIVILLNQDTEVLPGWIVAIINGLNSDPCIAIAGCKILYPDAKTLQHTGGILHENGLTDHYGAGEIDKKQYDMDRDCDYVTGAAMGFKRALIDQIGFFDSRFSPAYFEELDFCIRASRKQYRIRYFYKAKVIHHESQSTGKFSKRFFNLYHRNRLKFICKHFRFRYLLGTFRRSEWAWITHHMPQEQLIPLLYAYVIVCPRFVLVMIRDFVRGKL